MHAFFVLASLAAFRLVACCWRKAGCSDPVSWTERIALTGRTIKLAVQPAELLLEFPVGYPPGATWSLRQISEYRTSGNANCQYRSLLLLTQAGNQGKPTSTEVGAGSPGDGILGGTPVFEKRAAGKCLKGFPPQIRVPAEQAQYKDPLTLDLMSRKALKNG